MHVVRNAIAADEIAARLIAVHDGRYQHPFGRKRNVLRRGDDGAQIVENADTRKSLAAHESVYDALCCARRAGVVGGLNALQETGGENLTARLQARGKFDLLLICLVEREKPYHGAYRQDNAARDNENLPHSAHDTRIVHQTQTARVGYV